MHSLRRTLLVLFLALATLVASGSYAQPSHDECGCCTEAQQMMCAACKTCVSHALVAAPIVHAEVATRQAVSTEPHLNPSGHTEDIWHPPKSLS